MSIAINRSVNFGSKKAGLSTVGYELKNSIVESRLKIVSEKLEKSRKKEESLQIIVEMNKILIKAVRDIDKKNEGFVEAVANFVETLKINNEFEQIKEGLLDHVETNET